LLISINMRSKYNASVDIPEGVSCDYLDSKLVIKKGEIELTKKVSILGTEVKISEGKVRFICAKANKKNIAMIKAFVSHVQNMIKGVDEKFVYKLEVCNVHFPMTVKVEGDKVVVNNFLGEKVSRVSKVLGGVEVQVKGKDVTVSGHDLEDTGQTAANLEKATRVTGRDKRVFQDGIFLTEKPGGKI
jgi:large subunit ribosomal protein L6